ncbi:hypothetical protein JS565_12665 [Salmonella enterica subsp. enterica serovar Senftenberg]|nr:hypothetical protein [Salmonella enterica subsp. enterica serovar Senftenberg]
MMPIKCKNVARFISLAREHGWSGWYPGYNLVYPLAREHERYGKEQWLTGGLSPLAWEHPADVHRTADRTVYPLARGTRSSSVSRLLSIGLSRWRGEHMAGRHHAVVHPSLSAGAGSTLIQPETD